MSDFRKIYLETEISVTSREFIRTDPLGYSATRKRQAVAAVRTDDTETMHDLVLESLAVYGNHNAFQIISFWGDLIEKQIIENQ